MTVGKTVNDCSCHTRLLESEGGNFQMGLSSPQCNFIIQLDFSFSSQSNYCASPAPCLLLAVSKWTEGRKKGVVQGKGGYDIHPFLGAACLRAGNNFLLSTWK